MSRFVEFSTPNGLEVWIDVDKIAAVTFPRVGGKPGNFCFVFLGPADSDSYTIAIPPGWSSRTFMEYVSQGKDPV